jgi:tRNA U38,U39,U40 pseudouridine synthase TruA
MPPVGFEPRIAAGERSYTYALKHADTGTGPSFCAGVNNDFSYTTTLSLSLSLSLSLNPFVPLTVQNVSLYPLPIPNVSKTFTIRVWK